MIYSLTPQPPVKLTAILEQDVHPKVNTRYMEEILKPIIPWHYASQLQDIYITYVATNDKHWNHGVWMEDGNKLFITVKMDYHSIAAASEQEAERIMKEELLKQLPAIKEVLPDFPVERLEDDMRQIFFPSEPRS